MENDRWVELSEQQTAIIKRLKGIAGIIAYYAYNRKVHIHVSYTDMAKVAECLGGVLEERAREDEEYSREQYVTIGSVKVFQLIEEEEF